MVKPVLMWNISRDAQSQWDLWIQWLTRVVKQVKQSGMIPPDWKKELFSLFSLQVQGYTHKTAGTAGA